MIPMFYKFLVVVIFPLIMGWGAMSDVAPVQLFMEFTDDDGTLIQMIDCYPNAYPIGKVRVQLNMPDGPAYYECYLTDEVYIKPASPTYGKKYA